ncbi:MAG: hypothetical protein ABSA83_02440 [Verrucomicrobiota bacterium]|jgi:hypothetical protein
MKKNQRKTTWQEKLADDKGFPKVRKIDSSKSKRWGHGHVCHSRTQGGE